MSGNRLILQGHSCPHCRAARRLRPVQHVADEIESLADDDFCFFVPETDAYVEEGNDTVSLWMRSIVDLPLDPAALPERTIDELRAFANRLQGAADALQIAFGKGGDA